MLPSPLTRMSAGKDRWIAGLALGNHQAWAPMMMNRGEAIRGMRRPRSALGRWNSSGIGYPVLCSIAQGGFVAARLFANLHG